MHSFKQKFDQSELMAINEEDGECQIEVTMIGDGDIVYSAVIWLDSSQRKDLIKVLQDMEPAY